MGIHGNGAYQGPKGIVQIVTGKFKRGFTERAGTESLMGPRIGKEKNFWKKKKKT